MAHARLQEWMERLAAGDRSAFDPMFEALWPMLLRFCLRFLGNASLAEDAAQQTLLKIFQRAAWFESGRPVLPWVFGLAVWECRTLRKKSRRRKEMAVTEAQRLEQVDPDADLERELREAELLAALREALDSLAPLEAESLVAAIRQERPVDVASATFRKRLQRARHKLRELWRLRYGWS